LRGPGLPRLLAGFRVQQVRRVVGVCRAARRQVVAPSLLMGAAGCVVLAASVAMHAAESVVPCTFHGHECGGVRRGAGEVRRGSGGTSDCETRSHVVSELVKEVWLMPGT